MYSYTVPPGRIIRYFTILRGNWLVTIQWIYIYIYIYIVEAYLQILHPLNNEYGGVSSDTSPLYEHVWLNSLRCIFRYFPSTFDLYMEYDWIMRLIDESHRAALPQQVQSFMSDINTVASLVVHAHFYNILRWDTYESMRFLFIYV